MQLLDPIDRQLLRDLAQKPLAPLGDDLLHRVAARCAVAAVTRRISAPRASSSRST